MSEQEESIEERLDTLDEITLSDYPYVAEVDARILFDPEIQPEEWVNNVKIHLEDQLSDLPAVVEVTFRERDVDGDGVESPTSCEGRRRYVRVLLRRTLHRVEPSKKVRKVASSS